MNEFGGCIAWILRAIAWIVIGFVTYDLMEPDSFFSVLVWLLVWHIATIIVSYLLLLIVIAIISLNE